MMIDADVWKGDLKSIVVAVWPTDSQIDKAHPPVGVDSSATGNQCPLASGSALTS